MTSRSSSDCQCVLKFVLAWIITSKFTSKFVDGFATYTEPGQPRSDVHPPWKVFATVQSQSGTFKAQDLESLATSSNPSGTNPPIIGRETILYFIWFDFDSSRIGFDSILTLLVFHLIRFWFLYWIRLSLITFRGKLKFSLRIVMTAVSISLGVWALYAISKFTNYWLYYGTVPSINN